MESTGLLEWLELPVNDKEQVQNFLDSHGQTIKDFIRKKWNEYKADNQENKSEKIMDINENKISEENNQNHCPVPQKNKAKYDFLQFQIKNKHLTFPNGKVNQEYRTEFNITSLSPEIESFEFEGLEAVGLQYNPDKMTIEGTPCKAGDHKIILKYRFKDWEEGKPISLEKEITLIINPDPRSLWNTIETPRTIEYYKPDEDKKFVKVIAKKTGGFLGIGKKETARKDMVAASQRGRSHAHEGKPRDDDFRLYFDEASEWYILTVADGAGSAKFSRKGSQIVCETVIEVSKMQLSSCIEAFEANIQLFEKEKVQENRKKVGDYLYKIVGTAAFKAYKNIEAEANLKGALIKDYSTTLILSICKKFEFGWFVGAFWVGDGGIGIYEKNTSFLKIMGEPDGGEFAGQTRFLTMPEIIQPAEIYRRLRFDIYNDFTALILMTDGVTDPKFETDAHLNNVRKWDALWKDLSTSVDFTDDNEQTADQLLEWLNFWSQGNHDDRTIAILF
jgi:serine/threonine protein phosphatase PrpC